MGAYNRTSRPAIRPANFGRSPSPGLQARPGWDTCPASLRSSTRKNFQLTRRTGVEARLYPPPNNWQLRSGRVECIINDYIINDFDKNDDYDVTD